MKKGDKFTNYAWKGSETKGKKLSKCRICGNKFYGEPGADVCKSDQCQDIAGVGKYDDPKN